HAARGPGGRLQRRVDPDARTRGVHGVRALPAYHARVLAVARGRLRLRVLELHAGPAGGTPPHELGLPSPARRARRAPLRRGLARRPRPYVATGRPARLPAPLLDRDLLHAVPGARSVARARVRARSGGSRPTADAAATARGRLSARRRPD